MVGGTASGPSFVSRMETMVGKRLGIGVRPAQGSGPASRRAPPNAGLFARRDVPAGLRRGFLLPGSEEVQDAAPPRAGGLADRPV